MSVGTGRAREAESQRLAGQRTSAFRSKFRATAPPSSYRVPLACSHPTVHFRSPASSHVVRVEIKIAERRTRPPSGSSSPRSSPAFRRASPQPLSWSPHAVYIRPSFAHLLLDIFTSLCAEGIET